MREILNHCLVLKEKETQQQDTVCSAALFVNVGGLDCSVTVLSLIAAYAIDCTFCSATEIVEICIRFRSIAGGVKLGYSTVFVISNQ